MGGWTDQGIVLSVRSFGEKDGIVQILTHHHGCHAGILKNIRSRTNQSLQVGTLAACHWKARLSEHMGSWRLEAEKSYLAEIFLDAKRLMALTVAAQFTSQLLPERHPYPSFFHTWKQFLKMLGEEEEWERGYILFEYHLLQELGFGLKLNSCAVTNTAENLKYVSPRTGCAVTEEVGRPYHDKLLSLPAFLVKEDQGADHAEILRGLELMGHFLTKHFSEQKYDSLFQMRQRFIETL
ncbi:MAG: DNA repair protein RecO [Alphaproteobacteria bacterium RIFCSPLOWO2_01_FULL_45_8]|nr:MAG: DNA repair protein RecO [Alphaproteobacteria bacterium GWA1_45_9]OFW90016.1 MAG: DNA repair protein RecO [Alphaproteobacteria bacterium RIFCSPHIGHO2_01_FULL_41_14]OFW96265.1 MAG: DNA repair protein RecO [Alphaproteobacteria bacterium RIFCSPLOWO2_01_FULL_45_8]HCI49208.1 DNA repair protein RecO [Holosporales bacterium]